MVDRSVLNLIVFGFATASSALRGESQAAAQAVAAAVRTEHARITLDMTNAPVDSVLRAIAQRAGLNVFVGKDVLSQTTRLSLHVKDVIVDAAFEQALQGTGLIARISNGNVLFEHEDANESRMGGIIVGTIVNAQTKRPIRGVSVILDDTRRGVTSGDDGAFRITGVSAGTHLVRARMIGYGKTTKTVSVTDGETATINFVLSPSANILDQVVVTGTVIPTELKGVSNAITVITAKELERRGITHIDQLFHGDVPGVFAQDGGQVESSPGQVALASRGSTYLNVNGVTALSQSIKTYVDGVELADASYLGLIDPRNIERIEILTGPQASTIYGSGAINGVMQIFTKRGTTSRPQWLFSVQAGLIQNNFSSAFAPQHDDLLQLSGVEGHMSYNVGGAWGYVGRWAVASNSTLSGFGGIRLQYGPFMLDASVRQEQIDYHASSSASQAVLNRDATGPYVLQDGNPYFPFGMKSIDQAVGLSATYVPVSWWSNTVTVGTDHETSSTQLDSASYNRPNDTVAVRWSVAPSQRLTMAGSTTLNVAVTEQVRAIVTAGGDGTNASATSESYALYTYDGSKTSSHNRGAFAQSQLSLLDAIFLTYGIRGEWNPLFGANVSPNIVPKYGAALVHDIGVITAKVRVSYGHATRPPLAGLAEPITLLQFCGCSNTRYGTQGYHQLENADLVPEEQRGGEGGVELYVGSHASLVVTRFNQTVNNLIQFLKVDSLPYTPVYVAQTGRAPWSHPYFEYQNLNVGAVRNQGWEGIGTMMLGPVTTKATLSNTKSRIIGITPRWRSLVHGVSVGQAFAFVPEHLWAFETQYSRNGTSVSLNFHGQGPMYVNEGPLLFEIGYPRLDIQRPRETFFGIWDHMPGYSIADVNVSHQFGSVVEGLLQVQNVANTYRNDVDVQYASIGRQSKVGFRLRM